MCEAGIEANSIPTLTVHRHCDSVIINADVASFYFEPLLHIHSLVNALSLLMEVLYYNNTSVIIALS